MKRHFGVYAVILKDENILLVRKTRGPYAGLLDLPGGRPEPGESFDDALVREVREETGVLIRKWEFMKDVSHALPGFQHTAKLYRVTHYDQSQIDMGIHQEDVGGALWRSHKEQERLTPFALIGLVLPIGSVDQHSSC